MPNNKKSKKKKKNLGNKNGTNQNINTNTVKTSETNEKSPETRVFLPGIDTLKKGYTLEYNSSAYSTINTLKTEWPCLTFDFIHRNDCTDKFPLTLYLATGSQANKRNKNKISIFKISKIRKIRKEERESEDEFDEEDEDNNQNEENEVENENKEEEEYNQNSEPQIEEKSFHFPCCVNRIKSMPQSSNIIASWSDLGHVYIYDIQKTLKTFDSNSFSSSFHNKTKPIFKCLSHKTEGFALDWSRVERGKLLSGDCEKNIFLTQQSLENGHFFTEINPFFGHSDSVEDLQWSPVENQVFASCSVDKSICIWDARQRKKPAIINSEAHLKDINVISWNKINPSLLCSGSDDNLLKIWDLRNFQSKSPAAFFSWHKKPITSIEWSPKDESVLACASEDDTISIWDLSLEDDNERISKGAKLNFVIPPQLLFLHQGQSEIKELHFYPKMPSLIVSTYLEGFNIFKPFNM